jgi:hypothetical protein
MAQTRNIIIVGAIAILVFSCFYFLRVKPKNILLLGGLDNRSGDLDISQQVDVLRKGVDNSYSIKGFRYTDVIGITAEIESSKKEVYVVLFSAGCKYANKIAQEMLTKNYSLNYLYVVEPYATSSTTSNSIQEAVQLGLPNKNVIVGNSKSVGKGVVAGATNTPSCSPSHWCSLEEVGKILTNK